MSQFPVPLTNLKAKLLGRTSTDEESARTSMALPSFSFESDDRPLVSTERLFRQYWQEETHYDPSYHVVEEALRTEQDIIVSILIMSFKNIADADCRSHGMARMIPEIH
jgi:hypothetical protein